MPRGRHRHSPPLHRLLPPTAIAGVSLVCALGPWLFTAPGALRVLAAIAAATATVGAAVMRRWDVEAGKRVADLRRAQAGDEWRHEEQIAELETDLEESRELRQKLERKLRARRAELQGLRNEHAALLRRYATAETERASALEGQRRLAIETTAPEPVHVALSASPGPARGTSAASPTVPAPASSKEDEPPAAPDSAEAAEDVAEKPAIPPVFSPSGSSLFLRANLALERITRDRGAAEATAETAAPATESDSRGGPVAEDASRGEPVGEGVASGGSVAGDASRGESGESGESMGGRVSQGESGADAGHYTVPTAVAVVPATPRRRPAIEGGFDFFGTQKNDAAMESVQNDDLADIVGQEALAVHKTESEARFKHADEQSRGVGQIIDLTAHDETERIDVQGLRTAAS